MKKLLIYFIIFIILTGCKTTVKKLESTAKFIIKVDKPLFSKKAQSKLVIKKDNEGKLYGYLTSPFLHWAKIEGKISENNEKLVLDVISFYFITNWPNGWTEGRFEASGRFELIRNDNSLTLKTIEPFEKWEIKMGNIKYFDDYYLKEEGLNKVKNRLNRIYVVNNYLKDNGFGDFYGNIWLKTGYGNSFKSEFNSHIFKDKKLPEEFGPLIKSGTLRRDYEESLGLFFMDYNMEYYLNNILEGSIFEIK